MIALMGEFAHAGVPQVCVSNSERLIVDTNLSALGIGGIVAFSISREDVLRGKPDPAPYLEACRRLGVTPARVLAVEDSDPGAWAAEAAGLALLCGSNPPAGLGRSRISVQSPVRAKSRQFPSDRAMK